MNTKDHAPSCPVTPCVCEEIPEEMYTKDSETPTKKTNGWKCGNCGEEIEVTPLTLLNPHVCEAPKSEWEDDFRKQFAIKATPNNSEDAVKAVLLEKYWQHGVMTEMVDFIRDLLQQQTERDIERMEKIKETPAYVNLSREWGQLDEDGICIAVSRQALEETISAWDDLITYKKDQLTK